MPFKDHGPGRDPGDQDFLDDIALAADLVVDNCRDPVGSGDNALQFDRFAKRLRRRRRGFAHLNRSRSRRFGLECLFDLAAGHFLGQAAFRKFSKIENGNHRIAGAFRSITQHAGLIPRGRPRRRCGGLFLRGLRVLILAFPLAPLGGGFRRRGRVHIRGFVERSGGGVRRSAFGRRKLRGGLLRGFDGIDLRGLHVSEGGLGLGGFLLYFKRRGGLHRDPPLPK